MEKYIRESLASGLIRPSSSLLGAGFFFVEKKDRPLRPCTNYRGLNQITVHNKYPLPLLSSVFELLQGAKVFSKLDLHNAYHLVCIQEGDEWKTAFNTHLGQCFSNTFFSLKTSRGTPPAENALKKSHSTIYSHSCQSVLNRNQINT